MKKLVLALLLIVLLEPSFALSYEEETYKSINSKINEVESIALQFQQLILNLNSQGAYTSNSLKLFSDMKDLIWQAKMLLNEKKFNDANIKLEEAKSIAPQITSDISFSFKINKGRLALEEASSLIGDAKKEGYEVKEIEDYYYNASSLFSEAKESFANGDYIKADFKIESVLEITDKISNEIKNLNTVKIEPNPNVPPTGFVISEHSWFSFEVGILTIAIIALITLLRKARRKKELRGISKLVRIKNRFA